MSGLDLAGNECGAWYTIRNGRKGNTIVYEDYNEVMAQADGVKKPRGADADAACRRRGFTRRALAVTFAGLDGLEKTRVSRAESFTMHMEEMKVPELVTEIDLKIVAADRVRAELDVCEEVMERLSTTRAVAAAEETKRIAYLAGQQEGLALTRVRISERDEKLVHMEHAATTSRQ